jgi:hypothetical protein
MNYKLRLKGAYLIGSDKASYREVVMLNMANDGRIILKWSLQNYGVCLWAGINELRLRPCEQANEPSCSVQQREFLAELNHHKLLKKKPTPSS